MVNVVGSKDDFSTKYSAIHKWVARYKVRTGVCELCGAEGHTEFANISGEYRRDVDDYAELCVSCHGWWDDRDFQASTEKAREAARAVKLAKTHCKYGHRLTPRNTYTYRGRRDCRRCRRRRHKKWVGSRG